MGIELSEREIQILQLIADGADRRQVGRELGIATNTVKTHLMRMSNKTGVQGQPALVAWAFRRGVIF